MNKKYRTLKVGEIVRKGDRIGNMPPLEPNWESVEAPGYRVRDSRWLIWQRPVCSKKAYRILKPNEKIRERDQGYDTDTRGWFYTKSHVFIGKTVSSVTHPFYVSRFRREIKPKAASRN